LGIAPSGTNIVLSWPAAAGQIYQVEYKNDLNATTWTTLGSPITGTGAPLVITNDLTGSPQRFYRIRLVP
jgi:hypothetical protein